MVEVEGKVEMYKAIVDKRCVKLWVVVWVALSLALVGGCDIGGGPPASPPTSHGGPVVDQPSLIDALRQAGHTVNPVGTIQQPFLSAPGNTVQVNNETIQVFEYESEAAASADAAKIPPDANIPGMMINWVAQPHFYRSGRIIVIYPGTDPTVLAALETALGEPFAVGAGGPGASGQGTPTP